MKSNKSFLKRLKVRPSGKIQGRKKGQCHFRGRKSSSQKRGLKQLTEISLKNSTVARFLPGTSAKTTNSHSA